MGQVPRGRRGRGGRLPVLGRQAGEFLGLSLAPAAPSSSAAAAAAAASSSSAGGGPGPAAMAEDYWDGRLRRTGGEGGRAASARAAAPGAAAPAPRH